VRSKTIAVLAVTTSILVGCGGGPGGRQTVRGTFVRVGGPAPGAPVPLPGTITARAATGSTFAATAGRNGRFTLSLPPGRYYVTGRSPLMQSGQTIVRSPPGPALVWIADRPDDLLVVGCRGWGRLGYVAHGAVSRYCLAHARCPVLAVPVPEMIRELRTRHHWRQRSSSLAVPATCP
jgi:nucleotide-binding universal stress UspA family protein